MRGAMCKRLGTMRGSWAARREYARELGSEGRRCGREREEGLRGRPTRELGVRERLCEGVLRMMCDRVHDLAQPYSSDFQVPNLLKPLNFEKAIFFLIIKMAPRKEKGKGKMIELPSKRKRVPRNPSRGLVIEEPQDSTAQRHERRNQAPSQTTFPQVEFASSEQREKFEKFMKNEVIPSRFFDHEALRTLGLYEGVRELCKLLSMERVFNMQYNSDPRLCYEFFSSYEEQVGEDRLPLLKFRLMNQDISLSFEDFCSMFGFRATNNFIDRQVQLKTKDFWFKLTGEENPNISRMNISHVQHPVYRLMLKWLGACVLGKQHYHLTRSTDVLILAQIQRPFTFSNKRVPLAIIKNFSSTAANEKSIACGGLITHIAVSLPNLGYVYNEPIRATSLMTISFLVNARDIVAVDKSKTGPTLYRWILHPQSEYSKKGQVRLPLQGSAENLTGRDHYCIPGALPDSIVRLVRQAQGSSSESEEESEDSNEEGESDGSGSEESQEGGQEEEFERGEGVGSPNANIDADISLPSHHSSHHTPAQPFPPQPAPQQSLPDDRAYFDQRFDAILAGQQAIIQSMESMRLYHEQQYKALNDKVDELYADHTAMLEYTQKSLVRVNDLWEYTFPQNSPFHPHDDGNWPAWPEVGQGSGQGAGDAHYNQGPNDYEAGAQGGGFDANVDEDNSDDSFHPPDSWFHEQQ